MLKCSQCSRLWGHYGHCHPPQHPIFLPLLSAHCPASLYFAPRLAPVDFFTMDFLGHWGCLDHSTGNQTCQGLYIHPAVAHSKRLTVGVRRASSLTSMRQFRLQNAHGIRPRLRLGIAPVPSSSLFLSNYLLVSTGNPSLIDSWQVNHSLKV